MKNIVMGIIGAVCSFVTYLFGGWDYVMVSLLIFMALDLITGVIVAMVFHKSPKTESGTLESRTMFKGLCRKFVVLFFVLIGHQLDVAIGVEYIRNMVAYGFMANELLSMIENAGLMGIPIPSIITKSIEVLKGKSQENEQS